MKSPYYVIRDGEPVQVANVEEWASEQGKRERQIAKTELFGGDPGGVTVSTVFLGIDHSFGRQNANAPVLWETMTFGGDQDGDMMRHTSQRAALIGHALMVSHRIAEQGR